MFFVFSFAVLAGSCASGAGAADDQITVDSARAVTLATAAYARIDPDLRVYAAQVDRDDDGYLVSLLPAEVMLGGGALIRVGWKGRTRIIRRYE
jgi:hypothetical protein